MPESLAETKSISKQRVSEYPRKRFKLVTKQYLWVLVNCLGLVDMFKDDRTHQHAATFYTAHVRVWPPLHKKCWCMRSTRRSF